MRSNSTPFFYVHIQKTAGTSFHTLLDKVYGAGAVYPNAQAALSADPARDLKRYSDVHDLLSDPRLQDYRAFIGHLPYGAVELLPFQVSASTVLRHPVERTVSLLDHLRRAAFFEKARELTLEEMYEDPVINAVMLQDFQTRMLGLSGEQIRAAGSDLHFNTVGGEDFSNPKPRRAIGSVRRSLIDASFVSPALYAYPVADDEIVSRAHHALRTMPVAGVIEELDKFVDRCARYYSWPVTALPQLNSNPARRRISWRFKRRIVRDNPQDMELYKLAQSL